MVPSSNIRWEVGKPNKSITSTIMSQVSLPLQGRFILEVIALNDLYAAAISTKPRFDYRIALLTGLHCTNIPATAAYNKIGEVSRHPNRFTSASNTGTCSLRSYLDHRPHRLPAPHGPVVTFQMVQRAELTNPGDPLFLHA